VQIERIIFFSIFFLDISDSLSRWLIYGVVFDWVVYETRSISKLQTKEGGVHITVGLDKIHG